MTVFLHSLGCDKNTVDSEHMLGMLENEYSITDDPEQSDIIIVNTCSFIEDALMESIDTILTYVKYTDKKIIVCGCLAERYKEKIMEEIPEVYAVMGNENIENILTLVQSAEKNEKMLLTSEFKQVILPKKMKRYLPFYKKTAYLKIAEGCDKHCTYCVIPQLKGSYVSRKMDDILEEASELAQRGIKELVLVAQDCSAYGVDLYKTFMIADLLKQLCKIEGIVWIRLLYLYPEHITTELLDVMATEEKICHYFDIPIQHASDTILKRMGRSIHQAEIKFLIHIVRDRIPDAVLRTSIICGFPGETEEDVIMLEEFLQTVQFDHLGVFTYSREEGSSAYDFPDQISKKIKKDRVHRIMHLQKNISKEKLKHWIGRHLVVLIEARVLDAEEENYPYVYQARSYRDSEDIDGLVFVKSKDEMISGEFVTVLIQETFDYDMLGVVIEQ